MMHNRIQYKYFGSLYILRTKYMVTIGRSGALNATIHLRKFRKRASIYYCTIFQHLTTRMVIDLLLICYAAVMCRYV